VTFNSRVLSLNPINKGQFPPPGDFLIKNETVESKFSIYHWPRVHRLEIKIENHDDLLSFAQIDIIDTDVSRERERERGGENENI
jgi:hypothetical protein